MLTRRRSYVRQRKKQLDAPKLGNDKIIINVDGKHETRVALVHNNRVIEYGQEGIHYEKTWGNIYKGVIQNVEPSLQAAFVDIGRKKNAYLPFENIHPEYYQQCSFTTKDDKRLILENLKKGTEILVQIIKEETLNKGAAVTTYLSIPGRYLVLMPGTEGEGVSRKIEDEATRQRLREILKRFKRPEGVGLIARTSSIEAKITDLKNDFRYLMHLWDEIKKKAMTTPPPALLYKDWGIVERFLREYLSLEVGEIIVDDEDVYHSLKTFLSIISPEHEGCLTLYRGKEPIFTHYGIERDVEKIFESKVELPSGGYIVIEPTEALIAIDVNSGKSVKERDLEMTALKTNLEAAEEIARQLRLRDLGGIIVVDFIDMKNKANINLLEKKIKEEFKRDKAKSDFTRISKFGLMEITRQKLYSPLERQGVERCPCCDGKGFIKTPEMISISHLRTLKNFLSTASDAKRIRFITHPLIAYHLLNSGREELYNLEKTYSIEITVEGDQSLRRDEYKILEIKREGDKEGV